MSHLPLYQHQIDFVSQLLQNRIDWLDPFFRFLHYFDSPIFFLILIPLIWLGYSYQWGLRIFYWLTGTMLINSALKGYFAWSRPSTDMPELGLYHPKSYGFPSGGAQTCMFLGALLIYYWRTPLAWIIGLLYIGLISFSRLYLGVHYPIDILGGWAIALLSFLAFIKTKEPLESWLDKIGPQKRLILSLAIPFLLMALFPQSKIFYNMGACVGIGIGAYYSLKHHLFLPRPKDLNEGIGRSFIGLCLLFLIYILVPGDKTFFKSFLAALFMSIAASPLCKWFMFKKFS